MVFFSFVPIIQIDLSNTLFWLLCVIESELSTLTLILARIHKWEYYYVKCVNILPLTIHMAIFSGTSNICNNICIAYTILFIQHHSHSLFVLFICLNLSVMYFFYYRFLPLTVKPKVNNERRVNIEFFLHARIHFGLA